MSSFFFLQSADVKIKDSPRHHLNGRLHGVERSLSKESFEIQGSPGCHKVPLIESTLIITD